MSQWQKRVAQLFRSKNMSTVTSTKAVPIGRFHRSDGDTEVQKQIFENWKNRKKEKAQKPKLRQQKRSGRKEVESGLFLYKGIMREWDKIRKDLV